jgi:SAM-dependent methyltransferase
LPIQAHVTTPRLTTPSLFKPRAPLRPSTAPAPRNQAQVLEDVRAAAIRDVLQPYLFDDATFRDLVCEELRNPVARPRIIEFGCGTGALTVPALAARRDAVYHGFDRSEANVAIATCKLSRQGLPPGGTATFTAPFELDSQEIGEALQGLRADFLILPRFLQTVPLCATDGSGLNRAAFLALCRQLVKPGGRMLIIEDVYGADADEQAEFSFVWRNAFRARLTRDLEGLRHSLEGLDAHLATRLARLPGDPSLLGELRERAQPQGAQVLPLPAWERMFEHLGFAFRTVRHTTQRQLYLFSVRC